MNTAYLDIESNVSLTEHEQEINDLIQQEILNAKEDSPFKMYTEEEFYETLNMSIKQLEEGQVRDAFEALDEICAELGIK